MTEPRHAAINVSNTRTRLRRWRALTAASAAAITVAMIVGAAAPPPARPVRFFSDARMIIELNNTAGDVGVQMFIDGEPWKQLKVFDPRGIKVLDIGGSSSLRLQGLTELFFESSEPPLVQVSLAKFLARFPKGVYELEGVTIKGNKIEGEALFTHSIPAAPVILSPLEDSLQDPDNTVVTWEDVPNPPGSVIDAYQVIVTQLLDVRPRRMFSVHVPASVTSVTVPVGFMRPNADYEFEVLAIEAGGNQTITTSIFSTLP